MLGSACAAAATWWEANHELLQRTTMTVTVTLTLTLTLTLILPMTPTPTLTLTLAQSQALTLIRRIIASFCNSRGPSLALCTRKCSES